jgi:hypothetical protein
MTEAIPIVSYTIRGASRTWRMGDPPQNVGHGYLVLHQGEYWCFPNEESARTLAFQSGEFRLDQSRLREQPDTGADRILYLYLGEVDATPQEPRTLLPPQRGCFQTGGR